MKINAHYLNLRADYLFAEVAKRAAAFKAANPGEDIIRLGIGDVTLPLAPAVVSAMERAAGEMGAAETFRGYGPYEGYEFLRAAVADYYAAAGVTLSAGEIFIGDGAKSDLGNILDIFSPDNAVLLPDPVYPAYADANIMAGRKIIYARGCAENDFLPPPPGRKADIIYICSPNNPTGAVYGREALRLWVKYALEKDSVILFDSAYEAFITDRKLPASIYEIDGARECAVEFRSFSKTAGFTGVRCGYTVVPKELKRDGQSLNALWTRRQSTKFNGVSYIVQRGAEAALSPAGMEANKRNIGIYLENARSMSETLKKLNVPHTGGQNSPYVWFKCPKNLTSWEFFDLLLKKARVVGTPGSGFGPSGEGYFRFTAFNDRANTEKAMERAVKLFA